MSTKVIVGRGSCGVAAGAAKISDLLAREIGNAKIDASVAVTGCIGMCYLEPIVDVVDEKGCKKT